VISKGDELLLDLRGRNAWHFPRNEEGRYAGYYPADSQGAIDHLEHLHRAGAGYLVIPETSRWWLEHYEGFRQHLESNHRLLAASPACHLYSLGQPSPTPSPSEGTGQPAITELRERLEQLCQRMDELHDALARRSPTSAAKHAPPQRASTTRRRANALKTPTRRLTRKP
jgi:hypothetical protein